MATNEPLDSAADEVIAAEAELKAAQEKLEAAKAKLAATSDDASAVGDEAVVAAVVVEEVSVASEPTPEPDVPVVSATQAPSEQEPTWVPYSTTQTAPSQPQTPGAVPPTSADAGAAAPGQPSNDYYAAPGYAAPQTPPHAGPGAVPPQQPYYGYQQPYYQQPYSQPMVTTKDHVAAGLLAIFLGAFGIHKFYLGYNTAGFIMLAVTIIGGMLTFTLASWVIWVIAVIEGILYLTKSQTEFEQIYVLNKREWF